MTNKIFALIGPHASGKSTILHKLKEMGICIIPVYTTRVPTEADRNNTITKFLSKSAFSQKDWIVKSTYKGDYYGISKEEALNALKNHQISVTMMDINGLKQIRKLLNGNMESVYIMVDYVTMVERMLRMGHTNIDMKYHLEYAENNGEFDNWKSSTHVIKNTTSPEKAIMQLMAIMGLSSAPSKEILMKI